METNNILYVKKNGKYIPARVEIDHTDLSPGLWAINIKPGCFSASNADYIGQCLKVSDLEIPVVKQVGIETLVDIILGDIEFQKYINSPLNIHDLVGMVLKKAVEYGYAN